MSLDPDRPADADPTPPKSPTESGAESAEPPRFKRRFKKSEAEAEEGGRSDQTIEMLSTLLQDLKAKKDLPSAPPEPEVKTAKYHRLSKTGSGAPNPPPSDVAAVPAAPPAPTATVEAPSAPPAPPAPPTFRPAPTFEAPEVSRRVRRLHILYTLAALALAGAAYYAGSRVGDREAQPAPTKTAALPATAWDEASLKQLDQALAADRAGDLKEAQRIASALQKPGAAPPPGLNLYLASLGTRQEHNFDVEADLLRALGTASPEAAAQLNERLAFNFARVRDFTKADGYFEVASRLDPFSPLLFYHWGELSRHLGHFQEAAAAFRRALERVPTGQPELSSLRECIEFKSRLALVEEGRDAELQTELAAHLNAPQPSGYWLLTAAAVALQHKNLSEAAGDLGRARDALGAATFGELLNDYFFRGYADRKELADFFPVDPAARRAQLQGTMTYTVEP